MRRSIYNFSSCVFFFCFVIVMLSRKHSWFWHIFLFCFVLTLHNWFDFWFDKRCLISSSLWVFKRTFFFWQYYRGRVRYRYIFNKRRTEEKKNWNPQKKNSLGLFFTFHPLFFLKVPFTRYMEDTWHYSQPLWVR